MRLLEVSPRLYLGDCAAGTCLNKKITHVVTVDPNLPQPKHVKFLRIPVYDDNESDLLPWFPQAVEFLRAASDDAVEFPHDLDDGYNVTVRLRRNSPDVRWGISWHQGLFKNANSFVVDDVLEESLMSEWNQKRFDEGWQVRYGDRLDSVNGYASKSKEARASLQRDLEVTLVFWRNRALPRGASLVHCHAGVSRSVAVIMAYWMAGGVHPKTGLRRLQSMARDVLPNAHFMEELFLFWAMSCSLEGNSEAHKQYHLFQMQKQWERKNALSQMPIMEEENECNSYDTKSPSQSSRAEHDNAHDTRSPSPSSRARSPSQSSRGEHDNAHDRSPSRAECDDAETRTPSYCSRARCPCTREECPSNDNIPCAGDPEVPVTTHAQRKEFRCRKCRFALFTTDEEVMHEAQSGECTSLFTQPMNWMGSLTSQTGKLACVCGAKLGSYSWFGLPCSCKTWQVPAFQVHRTRLDEVPI